MNIDIADAKFGAYLTGGLPSASQETINCMALLFDRIFIPFNPTVMLKVIENGVKQFKRVKKIETGFFFADLENGDIRMKENSPLSIKGIRNLPEYVGKGTGATKAKSVDDLFHKFVITLAIVTYFYEQAFSYMPLFGDIVYANLFDDGKPFNLEQLPNGMWRATAKSTIELPILETHDFERLMDKNYFPVVTSSSDLNSLTGSVSTKSLATLLAMKSVKMFLPEVGAMDPNEVLEARKKLSDNLSQFWAGMLRLSKNLKAAVKAEADSGSILEEAQELVDSEVVPAVIELKKQMELERKTLFLKLLDPIRSLVKLFVGTASMNPQTLAIGALDASGSVSRLVLKHVENMTTDEKKRIFSFLLQLPKATRAKAKGERKRSGIGWLTIVE